VNRLVLIRHGESVVTVERVIGGLRTCRGLSPLGVEQAWALRRRLRSTGELRPDSVYTSTMPRARQTAEIALPAIGDHTLIERAELCEHDPGDCDGMTFAQYVERYGRPSGDDPDHDMFPGGETTREFHSRVAVAIDAVLTESSSAVVFCHGGVIDAAMRHLLSLPMVGSFQLSTVNTSVTELVRAESQWRLVRYNDAAHLHGLPSETRLGES
jgi:probable phosphoglycerate mutase